MDITRVKFTTNLLGSLVLVSPLQLVPSDAREDFQKMLRGYFASISAHLQKERRAMNNRERRNVQILQNKGELSEERKTENDNAQKAYDKLLTNTNTLAVSQGN